MAKRRARRRPAPKPQIRELRIEELGRRGDGIADADGTRIFMPYVLPGERVRAEVRGERGRVVDVLEAASNRVRAPCPHFGSCGGCAVQHMADDDYRAWKRGLVVKALGQRGLDVVVADLIDAHGAGRRRMTLHVRAFGGRVAAGFMEARGSRLTALEACPVLAAELAPALAVSRQIGERIGAADKGIDIQWTATGTGLDGDIRAPGGLTYDRQVDMAEVADAADLARLTWDGEPLVERRQPTLRMGLADVVPAPGGFLQATQAGEETLSRLVLAHLGSAAQIADLYCGVGPFALRLARDAHVYAADGHEAVVAALDRAARHAPDLKPVRAAVRDLAQDPLDAKELTEFDGVVFDPPRAGSAAQAAALAASDVALVAAVSCDPGTFARDARILVDGGYLLEDVTPVDQFKYTGHVEIVGLFRRPAS